MKRSFFVFLVTIWIFYRCRMEQKLPIAYPAYLVAEEKPKFKEDFFRGEKLYAMSCAACHNIRTNGKDSIPKFSIPQLLDYEMRIIYPSHQGKMSEEQVSPEELDQIVIFLRYRLGEE